MKSALFIVLTLFLICPPASAEELLSECNDVRGDSRYKPLHEYFLETNNTNDRCQRLNRREFVYTDNWNFYYCKVQKEDVLSCEEHEKGIWYPNLSVAGRFSGKNGKKFVLLKTGRLSRGIYGSGYHVFFLVPRSVNERGYTVFTFEDVGEVYGSDSSDTVSAMQIPFEILHNRDNDPILRFNQEIISRKTGEKFIQTLEYTWQNRSFVRILDKREVVPHRKKAR